MSIRCVFLDIDGTLTNGQIIYSSTGEELKSFNIKDGLAIASAIKMDYRLVVITGRKSEIVKKRMTELGVVDIYQNVGDKKRFALEFSNKNGIEMTDCCYIGDDLNDFSTMRMCGFRACPADACIEIRSICDFVSCCKGGDGAIREIFEVIFKKDGNWNKFIGLFDDSLR